jgi:hypothetical protein
MAVKRMTATTTTVHADGAESDEDGMETDGRLGTQHVRWESNYLQQFKLSSHSYAYWCTRSYPSSNLLVHLNSTLSSCPFRLHILTNTKCFLLLWRPIYILHSVHWRATWDFITRRICGVIDFNGPCNWDRQACFRKERDESESK